MAGRAAALAAVLAAALAGGACGAPNKACPGTGTCSGHGTCVAGVCVCDTTWEGPDCSRAKAQHPVSPSASGAHPEAAPGFPAAEQMGREADAEGVPASLAVCIVTAEVVGPVTNGGIGTAYTTLALRLAEAGHKVTIVFTLGPVSQFGPFEDHAERYRREHGVELVGLHRPNLRYIPRHMLESYEVYRYLKARRFDVVHVHDYFGAGYYPLLARSQGLALRDTSFVLGVHGPNLWAKKEGNQETIDKIADLEMDWMERKVVELADAVVSPSQYILRWMSREGWKPNRKGRTYVQPNVLPTADRRDPALPAPPPARDAEALAVRELVFFARLETRKGVEAFMDAVETLLRGERGEAARLALHRVTFMGRSALVRGQWGVQYVQQRAQGWAVPWKVITRLGPVEAKAYLSEPGTGRLAVMPSRVENSPYTVYECAELGIPFLAFDVGGVRDLVHAEDADEVLVDPAEKGALATRLAKALVDGARPARAAVAALPNEEQWLAFHRFVVAEARRDARELEALEREKEMPMVSVVMTHYNRPDMCRVALASVRAQKYPASKLQVILVDDGSTGEDVPAFLDELEADFAPRNWTVLRTENRYLGAARNAGFKVAVGKYVLFMDDDNIAKSDEVMTFAIAAERGGADVLTSFVNFFWDEAQADEATADRPSYLFLGGSADVGAFKNCYGDANCFVRRESFERIGGYTEDYGVGFEDWEMYANASLRGFQVDIVPESVYFYRFTPGSMQRSTNYFVNRRRSLRPYLNSLPPALHRTILQAVFPRKADGTIGAPTGLAAEGDARFHGVDEGAFLAQAASGGGPPGRHDEL